LRPRTGARENARFLDTISAILADQKAVAIDVMMIQ
jgi:hypothetical protein